MTARLRTPAFLLPVLLASCAAPVADDPLVPVPEGTYRFTGAVEGRHFAGVVFLRDSVEVIADGTTCRPQHPPQAGELRRRQQTRSVGASCNGVRLTLRWDEGGHVLPHANVDVAVKTQQERRGACVRWEWINNQRGRCLEYERVFVEVTRWVSGVATIAKEG